MSDLLRIGLVQMNSRSDKTANLAVAEQLVTEAAQQGAQLVALPEYVNFLGPRELHDANAEPIPGPTTERFAELARRLGIYLLGGSILERSEIPGKFYNTSVLYGPDGSILAIYRKIHLFDVDLTGNVTSNESATILPTASSRLRSPGTRWVSRSATTSAFRNCTGSWLWPGPNSSSSPLPSPSTPAKITGTSCCALARSRTSATSRHPRRSVRTTPASSAMDTRSSPIPGEPSSPRPPTGSVSS